MRRLGLRFQFQPPLLGFLPDFLLPDYKIVIECNGVYWHGRPEQRKRDRKKYRRFRAAGYGVMTVQSEMVAKDSRPFEKRLTRLLERNHTVKFNPWLSY